MNDTSRMRRRIEELEEENRQLRAELRGQADPPITGLTPTENLIAQLLKTGKLVRLDTVNLARATSADHPMTDDSFKVHILRLRQKTRLPIETVWGQGYRLGRKIRVEAPVS